MDTHTYDEFPYRCVIRPDIQPNQLATLATLFNLQPPAVPTSRILELGCGNGINLIAIAQSFPQAHCVGIDYSAQQIADGQRLIEEIGLSNIHPFEGCYPSDTIMPRQILPNSLSRRRFGEGRASFDGRFGNVVPG